MTADRGTRRASAEAATWLARLSSDRLTPQERAQHEQWLNQSQLNRDEFTAAQRVWALTGALQDLRALAPAAAAPWWRRPALAWAALLLLTIGVTSYVWLEDRREQSYVTAVGESRTVELRDGSKITLNTDTRVRILGSGDRRLALDGGEAFFAVNHDRDTPFVVEAGGGEVRVLGTRFNVLIDKAATRIAVVEGKVELTAPASSATTRQRAILAAGEAAEFSAAGGIDRLVAPLASRSLAWREGKFVFDGTPLDEVVREIDRYWPGDIVIADPAIRSLQISGTFPTSRIVELLHTLEHAVPIEVLQEAPDRITLVAKEPDAGLR